MSEIPQNPWPHVFTDDQWKEIAYENTSFSAEYNNARRTRLMLKYMPAERALEMACMCVGILNDELAGTWDSAIAKMGRMLKERSEERKGRR